MHRAFFIGVVFVLTCANLSAREAVCLMQNGPDWGKANPEDYGIWLSYLPSKDLVRITDFPVRFSALSPDGRRIAYAVHDSIFVMNNDGTARRCIIAGAEQQYEDWGDNLGQDANGIYWSTSGIFWIYKNRIHRYEVDTDKKTVLPIDLMNIDGAKHCEEDGIPGSKERVYHASRDGRHVWICSSWNPPVDSIYCGVRGYNRGGRLRLEWNEDFTECIPLWRSQWGHGRMMSAEGYLFLVHFGFHRNLNITKQTGRDLETLYEWGKYDPPYEHERMEARIITQCINNDSLVCSNAYCKGISTKDGTIQEPEKNDCFPDGMHMYLWNWRTNKLCGEFPMPNQRKMNAVFPANVWDGPLPARESKPVIQIDKELLLFSYNGRTNPSPKTVCVSNGGGGVLGRVEVAVKPTNADWLSVRVLHDDEQQRIEYTVNGTKLTGDSTPVEVTIHGGGAVNTVAQRVVVYAGTLMAPPILERIVNSGDSLHDAQLEWEDNSFNENGFCIERKTAVDGWKQISCCEADETSYIDTGLRPGTHYFYRVKAYNELDKQKYESSWSNVESVTITGISWIVVDAPVKGDKIDAESDYVIRWRAHRVDQVYIEYSRNDGLSWEIITKEGGISAGTDYWGAFPWHAGPSEAKSAYIRVHSYNDETHGISGPFSVVSDQNIAMHPEHRERENIVLVRGNDIHINAPPTTSLRVSVYRTDGKQCGSYSLLPDAKMTIGNETAGSGIRVVCIAGRNGSLSVKQSVMVLPLYRRGVYECE